MDDKRNPDGNVINLHRPRASRIPGCLVGQLVGLSPERELLVTFPGNQHVPLVARSTVALTADEVRDHVGAGREVLITFEAEWSDRPIVMGVIQQPAVQSTVRPIPDEVTVDEKTLVIEGRERVELRCGKASIILTRDGKVMVRGTFISSRSSGAYRIRGGSVEIN